MKTYLIILFALVANIIYAQDLVTVYATGTGDNSESALKSAMRDAIAQVAGVYLVSETKIINDAIKSDEIWEVSSGNIVKYDIINQSDKKVTIKAIVSLKYIDKYLQTKGKSVDFNGLKFSFDLNQLELNKKGELKVMSDLYKEIELNFNKCIDFEIKTGVPVSVGSFKFEYNPYTASYNSNPVHVQEGFYLPILVQAYTNKNIVNLYKQLKSTIEKLSMSESEINTCKTFRRKIWDYSFSDDKSNKIYHLRNRIFFEVFTNGDGRTYGDGSKTYRNTSLTKYMHFYVEFDELNVKLDEVDFHGGGELPYRIRELDFWEKNKIKLEGNSYDEIITHGNIINFPQKNKILLCQCELSFLPFPLKFISSIKKISVKAGKYKRDTWSDILIPEKYY